MRVSPASINDSCMYMFGLILISFSFFDFDVVVVDAACGAVARAIVDVNHLFEMCVPAPCKSARVNSGADAASARSASSIFNVVSTAPVKLRAALRACSVSCNDRRKQQYLQFSSLHGACGNREIRPTRSTRLALVCSATFFFLFARVLLMRHTNR